MNALPKRTFGWPRFIAELVGWSVVWGTLIYLVMGVAGCSTTIIPDRVRDNQPSFDGGQANSGFLRFDQDGSGVITAHARDRYNALIEAYGKSFAPALQKDDGISAISPAEYRIDAEHLVKFATMNRWRKEGRKP